MSRNHVSHIESPIYSPPSPHQVHFLYSSNQNRLHLRPCIFFLYYYNWSILNFFIVRSNFLLFFGTIVNLLSMVSWNRGEKFISLLLNFWNPLSINDRAFYVTVLLFLFSSSPILWRFERLYPVFHKTKVCLKVEVAVDFTASILLFCSLIYRELVTVNYEVIICQFFFSFSFCIRLYVEGKKILWNVFTDVFLLWR